MERKSFRILMPTVWSLLLHFPRPVTLKEPAFKEVRQGGSAQGEIVPG